MRRSEGGGQHTHTSKAKGWRWGGEAMQASAASCVYGLVGGEEASSLRRDVPFPNSLPREVGRGMRFPRSERISLFRFHLPD